MLLGILIWGAAHLFAEPGKTVKVLWGLVEYTKPSRGKGKGDGDPKSSVDQISPQKSAVDAPEKSINRADPKPLPEEKSAVDAPEKSINRADPKPLYDHYTHGVTVENFDEVIKRLREKHALRELRPLETDRQMSKSPPRTFFFVLSFFRMMGDPPAQLARRHPFMIEIHHREQGKFIAIFFTTESDAERVRLRGDQEESVTVFFEPWKEHTTLLELPLERISTAEKREITTADQESLYVLDIVVR